MGYHFRSALDKLLHFQPNFSQVYVQILQNVRRRLREPSFTKPSRMCSVPMYS